jgi:hypothetical protein
MLLFLVGSFTQCTKQDRDEVKESFVEAHRELALQEWLAETGEPQLYLDNFRVKKAPVPDSLTNTSIGTYLATHPELPGYIQNALIAGRVHEMMTLQEFLLISSENIPYVVGLPNERNEITFSRQWVVRKPKIYLQGNYWQFKFGFLWEYGTI